MKRGTLTGFVVCFFAFVFSSQIHAQVGAGGQKVLAGSALPIPRLAVPAGSFTITPPPTGCGTDSSGTPTNNLTCGANGSSPYTGEGGATSLTTWCGGSVPGGCHPISGCQEELTAGTWESHTKYYLSADLNCGAASAAIVLTPYTDINLNGHVVTGLVYSNAGPRGWHLFGGEVNCTLTHYPTAFLIHGVTHYAYACLQGSNNHGVYKLGGGDQIKLHHVYGHNGMACAKYVQFDGTIPAPAGGWTEPAIDLYNMTFQSMPAGTTCPREYAGVYSETQPVEYHHIRGDIGATGQANAAQMLVIYGPGTNGTYPNYIHNNYLTCEPFTLSGGNDCRAILIDGAGRSHVQYNDVWPTNNRGTRLRDTFDAEVDHNYYHQVSASAIHSGDNDRYSGEGQVVAQSIHHNTFDLASGGVAILYRSQQGLVSESNRFRCASGGCYGSKLMRVENWARTFNSYPVSVSSTAHSLTEPSGSFLSGGAIKPNSVVSFGGFTNTRNNNIFSISVAMPTTLGISDPTSLLLSETSSAAHFVGMTRAYLYNSIIEPGLTPTVLLHYDLLKPSVILIYCNSGALYKIGNGQLTQRTDSCP